MTCAHNAINHRGVDLARLSLVRYCIRRFIRDVHVVTRNSDFKNNSGSQQRTIERNRLFGTQALRHAL